MFLNVLPRNFRCLKVLLSLNILKTVFACILFVFSLTSVQGKIEVCHYVQSPFIVNHPENCSLICSFKFQHAVSGIQNDEVPLCTKNSTLAVFCDNTFNNDCGMYHPKSFCKLIPCLCKVKHGTSDSYIMDSSLKVPKLHTCVLPLSNVNPDMSIIPFPWKTLVIVMGIVFVFAVCLICVRWLSPILRSMQAKRSNREPAQRRTVVSDEDANFFSAISAHDEDPIAFTHYFPRGMPRIYRASPRMSQRSRNRNHRASSRARYAACAQVEGALAQGTVAAQDKPPAYEMAIQLPPPAYEDVERALQASRSVEEPISQRAEIHAEPNTATSQV